MCNLPNFQPVLIDRIGENYQFCDPIHTHLCASVCNIDVPGLLNKHPNNVNENNINSYNFISYISPNPVDDGTIIHLNSSYIGNLDFEILDIFGRIYKRQSYSKSGYEMLINVDAKLFPSGIYSYRFLY